MITPISAITFKGSSKIYYEGENKIFQTTINYSAVINMTNQIGIFRQTGLMNTAMIQVL